MRIARVLTRLNLGGPARQALAADTLLTARGHHVRLFTGTPEPGEGDLFGELSRRGAGFIARTPLCFGFLSGTITRHTTFAPGDHRLGWPDAQLANWIDGASDLLAAIAAAPGLPSVQAALRFCLAFPEVSTTIPGILTAREAEQNAAASGLGPLPPDAVAAVLAINRSRQFFVAAPKGS